MKLRHFSARGVFGYIRFDFALNDSLTLLVGPNGSGKSTALQLMEALITPSVRDLALAEFDSAYLEFEDGGRTNRISASKNAEGLIISASWVDGELTIPELSREKSRLLNEDLRMASEYFRSLSIQLSSDPTFKAISQVGAPVFLGIERRHRYSRQEELDGEPEEVNYFSANVRRGGQVRRLLRGNLAAGLNETLGLVQEAYRGARRRVDSAQVALRNDVLLSAFIYSDVDRDENGEMTFSEMNSHSDFDIQETRREIEGALRDIGLSSDNTESKIGPFFDKLSRLLREKTSPQQTSLPTDVMVEFLMNKSQMDRLQKLIQLVQAHKKKADQNFGRIQAFLNTVNWFFEDSGKTVSLDVVGSLEIARRDGLKIPSDALSSGERQILIIFSHLFFNAFSSRSRVFVIDEPELSLHLRWQENLIPKIREASPEMQLIFATHSPDVVGDNEKACVSVGVGR